MRRDGETDPQALRGMQEGAVAHLRGILTRQQRTARLLATA
jgi:hypothetical protein